MADLGRSSVSGGLSAIDISDTAALDPPPPELPRALQKPDHERPPADRAAAIRAGCAILVLLVVVAVAAFLAGQEAGREQVLRSRAASTNQPSMSTGPLRAACRELESKRTTTEECTTRNVVRACRSKTILRTLCLQTLGCIGQDSFRILDRCAFRNAENGGGQARHRCEIGKVTSSHVRKRSPGSTIAPLSPLPVSFAVGSVQLRSIGLPDVDPDRTPRPPHRIRAVAGLPIRPSAPTPRRREVLEGWWMRGGCGRSRLRRHPPHSRLRLRLRGIRLRRRPRQRASSAPIACALPLLALGGGAVSS